MRSVFSMVGMLLVGGVFLLQIGCPKKIQTTQETASRTSPSGERGGMTTPQEGTSGRPIPSPFAGEEGISPGEAVPPSMDSPGTMSSDIFAGERASLNDILFDYDHWTLRPDAMALLESNARWFMNHPEASIQIEGHADERGTNEYNLVLAERRAKAVRSYLVSLGINQKRLSIISYGEEKPVCNSRNDTCFQKNRRAHFANRGS